MLPVNIGSIKQTLPNPIIIEGDIGLIVTLITRIKENITHKK